MRVIADLHIHSHYSRACSRELTPKNLSLWANKKGITVLGTGDFTHAGWLNELQENLKEAQEGLYMLKGEALASPFFMLTSEVSSIYKQGDKVRRVHNLLFAPSFETVTKLNQELEKRGVNLKADGRPIMGLHCDELLKICKAVDENIELVPAHVWTPHFGVFGSLSGFDSLEECYGEMAKYIFAIETGLSSDPKMNWQVSKLDNLSLISNSDAHSLRKLGREANVFEIEENQLSYKKIIEVIKNKNPHEFIQTIEFFPEEGKYHLDGHRDHKFSSLPEKTKKLKGICPICGKKLLLGVMHRADSLGDRSFGFTPPNAIPFVNTIPLEEIIAEALGVGVTSKKASLLYEQMVNKASEFSILLDLPEEQIMEISNPLLAQSIMRVRKGKVNIEPGYDGLFGKIKIYSDTERQAFEAKPKQASLF